MNMIERIAEYPVTEIRFARITVTIALPGRNRTATTVMSIDDRMLDDLKDLHMSKELRVRIKNAKDSVGRMMLMEFDQKNQRARALLKRISDQIVWHLSTEIGKSRNKPE